MIYEIKSSENRRSVGIAFCANCRNENAAAPVRKTIYDRAFRFIESYPMNSRIGGTACPICAARELEYEFTKLPRAAISRSVVIPPRINPAVFDQDYIGQPDPLYHDVIKTRLLLDRNWFHIVEAGVWRRLKTFSLAGPAHTLACANQTCPACGGKTTRKLAGIIVRYSTGDNKIKSRLLCSSCGSVITDHYKKLLLVCEQILRRAER